MVEKLQEKLEELKDELKNTKKNKSTEHAIWRLKARIAKLEDEIEKKKEKSKVKGTGFAVKKEGDVTIGLVGYPSVGKSTIITHLTNKESKIGSYAFTTLEVVPGLLHYKHTNFQILDLPGIIQGASVNKGFGKRVLSVIRACDLVVLVVTAYEQVDELLAELHSAGVRPGRLKPKITIERTGTGGIKIVQNMSENTLNETMITDILREYRILNAAVLIQDADVSPQDFIDAILDNTVYVPWCIVMNKIDALPKPQELLDQFKSTYHVSCIGISAERTVEPLKEFIYQRMQFIQVYLKEPRKDPDMSKPMVLRVGDTIKDLCEKLHRGFLGDVRYAKVKGTSVKYTWQRVSLDHQVADNDIIELTKK